MDSFDGTRLTKTYEMRVAAPPREVFPLLCPVREYDWIPYWDCRMIRSESGVAEPGCVFTTDLPGRGDMTWVVTRYEPPEYIQFTVFKPGSHTWNLGISVAASGPHGSTLTWRHEFTGLTVAGNRFLAEYSDDEHRLLLGRIERCLVHFLETGQLIDRGKLTG